MRFPFPGFALSCSEWLEDQIADIPPEAEWNCHLDMTDFNHGTDPIIWLQHYASEEERAEHARQWPEAPLPPKEKPPFDRDWRVPTGPF